MLSFTDLINFANIINNTDFGSLNDSIFKLTNSVESMCNLFRSVNFSNACSQFSHSSSPNSYNV